jgi:hypothetical protein
MRILESPSISPPQKQTVGSNARLRHGEVSGTEAVESYASM